MDKDIKDMTIFLNEIKIIKSKYKYIDMYDLTDRINKLLKTYAKKNFLFTALKCIHEDNNIELIIKVEHIRAEYAYKILKIVYESKYLLNIL